MPQYMVRTRRWKYIENTGSMCKLYDLQEDPGETANRIADPALAPVVREMRDRLVEWYDPAANPWRVAPST